MDLDNLSEEVPQLELATGIPLVYDLDEGKVTNKVTLE